ncbi:MAG: NAD-dependent epimerase/dehydratase family protein [Candidatus Kryptoniota bacterium]
MKALVTGSTGFVGSHLVEKLLQRGYEVRCFVRPDTRLEYINNLPVEFFHGDYSHNESLKRAVNGIDYVFHVGGVTKSKTKDGYFKGNYLSTVKLLEAILSENSSLRRFVLISSQAAVGPGDCDQPVNEETPCRPITTYGLSKLKAEEECLSVKERLPLTIIRPPAVYGPRDRDIFEFFNSANKHIIAISGFGRKILSLIHVYDLVEGITIAAENPRAVGQIYFIANSEIYDWDTIASITKEIIGKWAVRVHVPHPVIYTIAAISELVSRIRGRAALINFEKARDMVQKNWTCSPAKAERELGYRARLTIEEGIENTIRWYKQNNWMK